MNNNSILSNINFVTGIILIFPYLQTDSLIIKLFLYILLLLLVLISGKNIPLKRILILSASIIFFQILIPFGEVLFSVWKIDVTKGSLLKGIDKSLTFTGLILISLSSVSSMLGFPGKQGILLKKTLLYFEILFGSREKLSSEKGIINKLDLYLDNIFFGNIEAENKISKNITGLKNSKYRIIINISAVILFWGTYISAILIK
jgi:hypothetical protein